MPALPARAGQAWPPSEVLRGGIGIWTQQKQTRLPANPCVLLSSFSRSLLLPAAPRGRRVSSCWQEGQGLEGPWRPTAQTRGLKAAPWRWEPRPSYLSSLGPASFSLTGSHLVGLSEKGSAVIIPENTRHSAERETGSRSFHSHSPLQAAELESRLRLVCPRAVSSLGLGLGPALSLAPETAGPGLGPRPPLALLTSGLGKPLSCSGRRELQAQTPVSLVEPSDVPVADAPAHRLGTL